MRPAPTPMRGDTETMTTVSFQPLAKPMRKPHTNVVKRWMKIPTWSAMASFILLMSLGSYGGTHETVTCVYLVCLCTGMCLNVSYSDMRVLSSPTEVQSNHPISILMTFLKYIFLMILIWRAAAVIHKEIWRKTRGENRKVPLIRSNFKSSIKRLCKSLRVYQNTRESD